MAACTRIGRPLRVHEDAPPREPLDGRRSGSDPAQNRMAGFSGGRAVDSMHYRLDEIEGDRRFVVSGTDGDFLGR